MDLMDFLRAGLGAITLLVSGAAITVFMILVYVAAT